jgi:cell wall-associated NlpC family hydrolase
MKAESPFWTATRVPMDSLRDRVVAEARSWIGTPYIARACVKGSGVDCAYLLVGVYSAVGLMPKLDIGTYPVEWHMHRGEELYLDRLPEYCDPVERGEPADIVMFRIGRTVSHSGVLLDVPGQFVHAWSRDREVCVATWNEYWAHHLYGYFRVRGID